MKIAVFGGAFDPPHLGHLQIIKTLFQQEVADEVWLVPTGIHDFDKQMQPARHRITMLKLLIEAAPDRVQDKIKINRCELERGGVSQTYDTLAELAGRHPQHQLSWVMGSDNLAKFHVWENYQRLLTEFLVYIYPRLGFALQPMYTGMIPLTGVERIKVSSTKIKELLQSAEVENPAAKQVRNQLNELLPAEILKHIKDESLYQ